MTSREKRREGLSLWGAIHGSDGAEDRRVLPCGMQLLVRVFFFYLGMRPPPRFILFQIVVYLVRTYKHFIFYWYILV